jgi:hypothetical protein
MAVSNSVRISFHTVKPATIEEMRLLESKCCSMWATLASAVGETKLALTVIDGSLSRARGACGRMERRGVAEVSLTRKKRLKTPRSAN